jgi:PAS domain S-box-containing protein
VLAAVLPPLGALVIQLYFGQMISRWSFFYLAVFLSSWIGGFGSGAAATVLSLAFVWWFLMPHARSLGIVEPKHLLAASLFVLMGFLVSALQGRLRRSRAEAARALAATRGLNERLQKALKERQVFAALIENSSDFIGIADTEARPWYVNPAGRRMVGITADFPVDTTRITEFYPPDRQSLATEIVNSTLEHGHWHGETRLRHWQTGAEIPVSVTAFLIREFDDHRVLGIGTITRDISAIERSREELQATNRRLAEATEDLAENQRFLEAIMKYSPNGIVVKDLNGRYVKVNRQVERLLGMRPGEMTGKQPVDLFPRDVGERLQAEDLAVVEKRAPITTEDVVDTKDGPRVFLVTKFPLFEADGTVFAVCGIWSDITDRKQAEDAMRQSASDLREAQRVAHVGSWSWDPKTDTPRLSDELYRIFGMDPSLPVPKLFSEDSKVFTPESLAALRAGMAEVLAKGKPYQLELEVVRPDGSRRWLAAHGDAVRDASGQIHEITGTAQDITELKKLQQMREEWTSVIAHDLRQPIGVIASAADFLPELHAADMGEKELGFARRIAASARTLGRMVDDLLDLSLLEADRLKLERAWIDPRGLVSETVERLSHVTGRGRVKVSERGKMARVFADPMRVDQVLGNLISNAVKYGEENAEILVEMDRHEDEVELSVTNRGRGIAPEDLPRVFGRFVRTKTARGSGAPGLGVGLYIAKGLIEAHGGRMWAESTPGETTTFHLTLPCQSANREAA